MIEKIIKMIENRIKISIIVPIFNSESTLERCLNSLVSQSFDRYEIILVNDGSTDNSERICNSFGLRYPCIRYYYIPNSGVSEARNIGLKEAVGDYILFCDSEKTHEMNRDYREKDYPADIITFAIFADDDSKFILDNDINLGEIILALDKVREEAKKHNVSDNYELYFLIAHGILHLLGFDHQSEEDYNFVVEVQKKALKYAEIGEKDE